MRALVALTVSMVVASASAGEREVIGPPWFSESLVYHNDFEGDDFEPRVCTEGLEATVPTGDPVAGMLGSGALVGGEANRLIVRGPGLSPHRPLTVSLWWALPEDLPIDGGFGLIDLTGSGYVGLFCRGKGEWCGLQRPAGVFQIYYFDGIQDVNGVYDLDLASSLELSAGVWHHTAVVFRRASSVSVYTDGEFTYEATTVGRAFLEEDGLMKLEVPGALAVDDVAILDRAIDGALLSDYVRGVRRLREYRTGLRS